MTSLGIDYIPTENGRSSDTESASVSSAASPESPSIDYNNQQYNFPSWLVVNDTDWLTNDFALPPSLDDTSIEALSLIPESPDLFTSDANQVTLCDDPTTMRLAIPGRKSTCMPYHLMSALCDSSIGASPAVAATSYITRSTDSVITTEQKEVAPGNKRKYHGRFDNKSSTSKKPRRPKAIPEQPSGCENPDETEVDMKEERKDKMPTSHNEIEKKYRDRLNRQFDLLLETLGSDNDNCGDAVEQHKNSRLQSKAAVLAMARSRIQTLEKELRRRDREVMLLKCAIPPLQMQQSTTFGMDLMYGQASS
ncbi:hypothetical protein BX600DRAFT_158725 [Xylariales sp. PMI_506]|nr:hypothetical protein BX600DRAFT_158725 [Xylariales sp. PMI_506]